MGYMAGDYGGGYAAGDYYAGGILSGLGSIIKGAVRTGVGFVTGGPGGAARALAAHAISELHGSVAPGGPSALPAIHTADPSVATFLRAGGRFSQAGKAKLIAGKNAALQPVIHPMQHLLTSGHRRRMNWANPKAAGRAERRIHSLVKHMGKYVRWVHPTRAGHLVPKFGRKHKK